MAIWQYKLFVLPEEEVDSYFLNKDSVSEKAFNEIDWWKYRQIDIKLFEPLIRLLDKENSWSENIVQLGNLDSNCVELLYEEGRMVEISIRIDLRTDYNNMVKIFCEFADENDCVFLNESLKVLEPSPLIVLSDIDNNKYREFMDNL